MQNGCERCEKLPDGKLCDICELGFLEWTAEAAIKDYVDKVKEILERIQNGSD